MRTLAAAGAVGALAAAATIWVVTAARAGDGGAPAAPPPHRLDAAVAAGIHERHETDRGAIHVWAPAGYHADGAATVVYVHGYYTDVDAAWTQHRLAAQFALAAVNARFVACEAPSGARQAVHWRSLGELLATVDERSAIPRPLGPVVVLGHSGAFRTMIEWLDDPRLDAVVALDALYAELEPFRAWVLGAPRRRFVDVAEDTIRWSEELARDLAAAGVPPVIVERFPEDERGWPDEARGARAVLVRTQWAHMPIVTDGIVIPQVLRLLGLAQLPGAPWDHPLGDLPPAPPPPAAAPPPAR